MGKEFVKLNKIIIIVFEILWIVMIVSGTIRHGLPTDLAFWIAFLIEIVIGFIIYYGAVQNITHNNIGWGIFVSVLAILSIAIPITLYYSVDSMEHVGGTWVICALTLNSCYLYRMIKMKSISRQDVSPKWSPTVPKVIHLMFSASVLAFILTVVLLPVFDYVPEFSSKDPDLILIEIAMALVSLSLLFIGIYLHRIAGWFYKSDRSDAFFRVVHIIKISLFETIAMYGLILGILGGAWYAWLSLLIMAGAAMLFSYPTEKRWDKWKAMRATM